MERIISETEMGILEGLESRDQDRYLDGTLPSNASMATNEPLAANATDQVQALPSNAAKTLDEPLAGNAESELSDRDRRILELAGLSEMKAAAQLQAEGIKCSPRTVGNVRRRLSAE